MSKGGARKGAGRKAPPYAKCYWMLRVNPEHRRFIVAEAKRAHLPIGDFVAACVLLMAKQKKNSK